MDLLTEREELRPFLFGDAAARVLNGHMQPRRAQRLVGRRLARGVVRGRPVSVVVPPGVMDDRRVELDVSVRGEFGAVTDEVVEAGLDHELVTDNVVPGGMIDANTDRHIGARLHKADHLIEDGLDVKCLDWLNVARGGELGDTGDVPEHLLHRVNVRLEVRYTGFRRNALVVDRVLELVPDREEARRQVADLMEHERAEVSKVRLRTPLDLSPLHFHPLLLDRVPRRRALGL
mmetsp:Transcript_21648/g.49859  ORF Transcript_21648/g.49859 Transcript_21648/m.49859 type:complete len:233 (+) Transcript_21648:538-1236(+)